jgi:hypothetical protein
MKGGEFLDHLSDHRLCKEFKYNEHLPIFIIVVLQLKKGCGGEERINSVLLVTIIDDYIVDTDTEFAIVFCKIYSV